MRSTLICASPYFTVDFLQNVVPVRARHDKQLVSHDANNNSYNYQYTFMIEIVPICKEAGASIHITTYAAAFLTRVF